MAFGLKNLPFHNLAKLADRAIHRANKLCIGQRSGIGLEWPGKEQVEAGIAANVGVSSFGHIHLVFVHEPAYEGRGQLARLPVGEFSCQCG